MSPTAPNLSRFARALCTSLFTFIAILCISSELWAQYQTNGAFATRGARGRQPLSIKYDLEMAAGMQIGFVNVSVADPSGPSKSDRNLVAVVYVKLWGTSSQTLAFRQPFKLPEGATTASIEVPFPSLQSQIAWDVGIFEDDSDIEDTRNKKSNLNQQDYHWSYMGNQLGAVVQFAGLQATTTDRDLRAEEAKAFNTFATAKIAAANQANGVAVGTPGTVITASNLQSVDKASGDWRRYYPYPVWFASVAALAEIHSTRPDTMDALRTYVTAGGRVFIYEVNSAEALSQVDEFFGVDAVSNAVTWQKAVSIAPSGRLSEPTASSATQNTSELVPGLVDGKCYLGRTMGLGQVIVGKQPLKELLTHDSYFDMVISNNQARLALTTVSHDGSWFWQNLILEVGKPPVLTFCAMVTLFGGLLGPGLLYFTGRLKRRSLMIFLVPAVSLVATLAIVVYGVLHEGFGTHIRVHSVTAYDPASQHAFGWSRQNYFTGLPPREGLQFPLDAYVRTVVADDSYSYSGSPDPRYGVNGTVTYAQQQTWMNWLKPRQHQQLFVGHKVDPATIPISFARGASGAVQVSNLTDSVLPFVALRGEADDYFVATDLGAKKTVELQPQDHDSVAIVVGRIGADYKPVMPPEVASGGDSIMNFGNPRRYSRTYAMQSDILSEAYKLYLSDSLELPPFGFATLVPEFTGIAIPIEGTQADNVNLVIGVKSW